VYFLPTWTDRPRRRRFLKPQRDSDKLAAYQTLYTCLVTVAKLMAPFAPFISESMYQNLVRAVDPTAPESVHLCDFPATNPALIDTALQEKTHLVMKIASLGRAARSKANIKVRQPLLEIMIKPRSEAEKEALRRLTPQIMDELNVKNVSFADQESDLMTYTIKGRTNLLGPKYGREIPNVLKAISALDPFEVAKKVRAGQPVQADSYTLQPEEIDIQGASREGYAVAEDGDYLVAASTKITPELEEEGLARELVHRIQTMRKNADFKIEDRITTYYQGDEVVARVFQKFETYVKQETLSNEVNNQTPPSDAFTEEMKVDGHQVLVGVKR
jgi:isoleucyl-tRNA synthetase